MSPCVGPTGEPPCHLGQRDAMQRSTLGGGGSSAGRVASPRRFADWCRSHRHLGQRERDRPPGTGHHAVRELLRFPPRVDLRRGLPLALRRRHTFGRRGLASLAVDRPSTGYGEDARALPLGPLCRRQRALDGPERRNGLAVWQAEAPAPLLRGRAHDKARGRAPGGPSRRAFTSTGSWRRATVPGQTYRQGRARSRSRPSLARTPPRPPCAWLATAPRCPTTLARGLSTHRLSCTRPVPGSSMRGRTGRSRAGQARRERAS